MKSHINLFEHSRKVFYESTDHYYEVARRGLFDFPTKGEWLNDEWRLFCRNNPELVGLEWDEENGEWVHEYEGGSVTVIL